MECAHPAVSDCSHTRTTTSERSRWPRASGTGGRSTGNMAGGIGISSWCQTQSRCIVIRRSIRCRKTTVARPRLEKSPVAVVKSQSENGKGYWRETPHLLLRFPRRPPAGLLHAELLCPPGRIRLARNRPHGTGLPFSNL